MDAQEQELVAQNVEDEVQEIRELAHRVKNGLDPDLVAKELLEIAEGLTEEVGVLRGQPRGEDLGNDEEDDDD